MLSIFGKKINVCTHNGSFHADEVFACATLSIWAEKHGFRLNIVRSRDPEVIARADMAVDVGNEYDPVRKRFDHHQRGGAGTRPNGIPYASFGLVWKHYGEDICNSSEIANIVDKKLVVPIDAKDNGVTIIKSVYPEVEDYTLTRDLIIAFRKSWKEGIYQNDINFIEILNFARTIILTEINSQADLLEGKKLVFDLIKNNGQEEIVVLDTDIPWEEVVANSFKNIKYVIYPETETNSWCIETPRDDIYSYETNRMLFPESWRGLRDADLTNISGVKSAVFCHKGGFFAVVKTKDGALEMAKKALQMSQN